MLKLHKPKTSEYIILKTGKYCLGSAIFLFYSLVVETGFCTSWISVTNLDEIATSAAAVVLFTDGL